MFDEFRNGGMFAWKFFQTLAKLTPLIRNHKEGKRSRGTTKPVRWRDARKARRRLAMASRKINRVH